MLGNFNRWTKKTQISTDQIDSYPKTRYFYYISNTYIYENPL